jgi:hypothetical protein
MGSPAWLSVTVGAGFMIMAFVATSFSYGGPIKRANAQPPNRFVRAIMFTTGVVLVLDGLHLIPGG